MSNSRWRGKIPFRVNRKVMPEPLEQQGRGGEPSLANFRRVLDFLRGWDETARGKAEGSYTQRVRDAFRVWRESQGIGWHDPINFQYRLSRHKRIAVTLIGHNIYHRPRRGAGSKGFMLEGMVQSIDGLPPAHRTYWAEFAIGRIIGSHPIRLLTERTC